LKWGSLRWLPEFDGGDILGYERIYHDQSLRILINISEETEQVEVTGNWAVLFSSGAASLEKDVLKLPPNTGVILKKPSN
jgi:hypothetical protein